MPPPASHETGHFYFAQTGHSHFAATYDFVLLDTRGKEAFANGHIPGAWSIGLADLNQALSSLPKDRVIVTYCWGHD